MGGRHAVHALLYLAVSLLAVAMVFYSLGAPFVAALEVILYAGAILVMFLFVVMMLGGGKLPRPARRGGWIGPCALAAALLGLLAYAVVTKTGGQLTATAVEPKAVGVTLFSEYLLGVELASLLLMSALIGGLRLGRGGEKSEGRP